MSLLQLKTPKFMAAMAVVSALTLAGCAEGQNQGGAAIGGAILGGLLGSRFGHGDGKVAMTALGAMIGAGVGSSVGKRMDDVDRMRMREAEQRAYTAPLKETIIWNNPNTGNSGTITPVRDGQRDSGEYCREFQSEITVGGQQEKAYGTACQQPDGSWKIVSR